MNIYPAKSGFRLYIAVLKAPRLSIFFNLSGKMFQILEPKNETLSPPWYTEFIASMVNCELCDHDLFYYG